MFVCLSTSMYIHGARRVTQSLVSKTRWRDPNLGKKAIAYGVVAERYGGDGEHWVRSIYD